MPEARVTLHSSHWKWGKALLLLWWESAALLMAGLNVFLRSCWFFLLCPKSSVYFETATKSVLLSRQCCCCVSTKHPPLLCVCLATLLCPCLSVCDGWEESDFLLQNYPSKSLPQLFLEQPSAAFLFQPHVPAVSQSMASFSGLWAEAQSTRHCPHCPNCSTSSGSLGWQEPLQLFPRVHRKNLLKVKVSDFICYVNVFSLCSWNHSTLTKNNQTTTKTKQNPFTRAISTHYIFPVLSLWVFYQDRDQSLS